jgi:PAS domain S-box-containing protein
MWTNSKPASIASSAVETFPVTKPKHNIRNMMALDIYLMSLSKEKAEAALADMAPLHMRYPLIGVGPQLGFGVATTKSNKDLGTMLRLKRKYHWQIDLELLLAKPYQALVLTDAQRRIRWVSSGFRHMTGFPAKAAIGRKPSFLQGPDTDASTIQRLREALNAGQAVSADLINYRKNSEAYLCAVDITPLHDAQGRLTHFIALEYERT